MPGLQQLSSGGEARAGKLCSQDMDNTAFLVGQFLLAMPGIGDPRFEHAVIAICAHDEKGAMGVGIGDEVEGLGLHDLLRQFELRTDLVPDRPVHLGGPVETRRGFVLHSKDWGGQDTIDVAGRWSLSGTIDVLRAIAEGVGPKQFLVALGFAGWEGGQLEGELSGNGWFNTPAEPSLIYDVPAAERWSRGFTSVGIDPRLLVSSAGTA